jgi:DNA mismatch repair protein MSH5
MLITISIKTETHCMLRHPLQELCVDIFIPNDINLKGGKGFHDKERKRVSSSARHDPTCNQSNSITTEDDGTDSVAVVTGANFSGKSVYLKQTALIVYMAHIGRYIN